MEIACCNTLDAKRLQDVIEQHLLSKHVSLWQSWEVQSPSRRALAVQWLTNEVLTVLDLYYDEHMDGARELGQSCVV